MIFLKTLLVPVNVNLETATAIHYSAEFMDLMVLAKRAVSPRW